MRSDSTTNRQNGGVENGVNDSSLPSPKQQLQLQAGLNVEWSEDRWRLSRMGGLAYFVQFLQSTGMFEELVAHCPLSYDSNNAPSKRERAGNDSAISFARSHALRAHGLAGGFAVGCTDSRHIEDSERRQYPWGSGLALIGSVQAL